MKHPSAGLFAGVRTEGWDWVWGGVRGLLCKPLNQLFSFPLKWAGGRWGGRVGWPLKYL